MTSLCEIIAKSDVYIAPQSADSVLQATLDVIGTDYVVKVKNLNELSQLFSTLKSCEHFRETPRTVSFVAHSTYDKHLLDFGDFVLGFDDLRVQQLFAAVGRGLDSNPGITRLCLIGCFTATTPEGHNTINGLKTMLGIEVVGTDQMVYAEQFELGGMRHGLENILTPSWPGGTIHVPKLPKVWPPPGTEDAVLAEPIDLSKLPDWPDSVNESRWPVRRLSKPSDLSGILSPTEPGRNLPGLLTEPQLEFQTYTLGPSGQSFGRFQVLFQGEMVRVPEQDGNDKVYRVVDINALNALIKEAPISGLKEDTADT